MHACEHNPLILLCLFYLLSLLESKGETVRSWFEGWHHLSDFTQGNMHLHVHVQTVFSRVNDPV